MKTLTIGLALSGLLFVAAGASPSVADPPAEKSNVATYPTVASPAFAAASTGVTLFDVREPKEWAETGMPAMAHGVPISSPDFVERVLAEVGGDKSKPVAVICKSGTRSTRAADKLAAAGFTNVTNVGDGMMGHEGVGPGWLAAKLPTKPYAAQ
ncbi:MAG: rhodanese-like domain-containing protein [Alphaproteobacteria bacterium]|nr:rhodanese-like domain-containing protein [Alphaproteobacteria bacterium]